MKIIQIITGSPSFGGAEAHVRDLTLGLIERGHECIVMLGPPQGLLTAQLQAAGVEVIEIPALRKAIHPILDPLSLFQVVRHLRRIKPDVVAAHTAKAGFIGRIAAFLLGIPRFFTPHGLSFIDRVTGTPIRFRLLLERLALPLGGRIIAVCDAERELAQQMLRTSSDTITTINNCIPDRAPTPTPAGTPVIITMVARFDVQKDHKTLIQALAELPHLDWQLRLAGSGPLLNDVKSLAARCNLTERIHFLEECSDVPALLAGTDIFVLTTNWEAFPISILEAMREGLPIVATDIGGVREAVHDGENGFLIAPRDAQRTAHCLSALINAVDLRTSMGAKSRLIFSQAFTSRRMLEKTETLYASALLAPIYPLYPSPTPHSPK